MNNRCESKFVCVLCRICQLIVAMQSESFGLRDVNLHSKAIVDMKWSGDGGRLGTISHDKTVKISQLDDNGSAKCIHTIPCNNVELNVLCWHPSDSTKFAVVGEDKAVEFWDVRGQWMYYNANECFYSSVSILELSKFICYSFKVCREDR